jgi:transcriptional regulator with XRE-family HTH domain
LTDLTKGDGPHRLDVAIGQRIRERRRRVGMSQQALAEAVGITFQQVQKYERGTNRVSFSRLVEIADTLTCRLGDLAEGLDQNHAPEELGQLNTLLALEGAMEMLEAFAAIPSRALRRALIAHARTLSAIAEPVEP